MANLIATALSCGYNGTGISLLVSAEAIADKRQLNKCLINVGDGAQRFCKENRIKLSDISCIIISSLSPHNVSGFPGVFLSLSDMGIGQLTIVGPTGLKSYIELMTPFINRKYPELHIIEIDYNSPTSDLELSLNHMTISILPIAAAQCATRCIAIAASLRLKPTSSGDVDVNSSVSVVPVAQYFALHQSRADLARHIKGESDVGCSRSFESASRMVVFVPLAVTSCLNALDSELMQLCVEAEGVGFCVSGSPTSDECEFRYCQGALSLMGALCRPLFPAMLSGVLQSVQKLSAATDQQSETTSQSTNSDTNRVDGVMPGSLSPLLPLVSVVLGSVDSGRPALLVRRTNHDHDQIASKVVKSMALYREQVLPHCASILAGTYVYSPPDLQTDATQRLADVGDTLVAPFESDNSVETAVSNQVAANLFRLSLKNKRKLPESDAHQSLSCKEPFRLSAEGAMGASFYSGHTSGRSVEHSGRSVSLRISTHSPLSLASNTTINSANERSSCFDFSDSELSRTCTSVHSDGSSTCSPAERGMRIAPQLFFANSPVIRSSVQHDSDSASQSSSTQWGRSYAETSTLPVGRNELTAPSSMWEGVSIASGSCIPPPNPMRDVFKLTFLGTGCATPSKHRNNSSIMLALNSGAAPGAAKTAVLLDAGEGTAAQIFQSVSGDLARYDSALLSIKVVWISHHHADHIVGVPQLIEQIQRARLRRETGSAGAARNPPVAVRSKYDLTSQFRQGRGDLYPDASRVMLVASEAVMKYLEFSLTVAGLEDLVAFYPLVNTLYAGVTADVARATGGLVTRLRSVPVQHCHSSYGVVLDLSSQHKVVYSGDCRPSQSLVKAGMDCDLLIHEATFADSMAADALKKKHSTSSEARSIAAQMRARHTILTHFSQRYPVQQQDRPDTTAHRQDAPFNVNSTEKINDERCSVAFDFLSFSFPSQVGHLSRACSDIALLMAALEAAKERDRDLKCKALDN